MKSRHSGKQYAEIICKAIRHVYDGLYYKHRACNVSYVNCMSYVTVCNYLGQQYSGQLSGQMCWQGSHYKDIILKYAAAVILLRCFGGMIVPDARQ